MCVCVCVSACMCIHGFSIEFFPCLHGTLCRNYFWFLSEWSKEFFLWKRAALAPRPRARVCYCHWRLLKTVVCLRSAVQLLCLVCPGGEACINISTLAQCCVQFMREEMYVPYLWMSSVTLCTAQLWGRCVGCLSSHDSSIDPSAFWSCGFAHSPLGC